MYANCDFKNAITLGLLVRYAYANVSLLTAYGTGFLATQRSSRRSDRQAMSDYDLRLEELQEELQNLCIPSLRDVSD